MRIVGEINFDMSDVNFDVDETSDKTMTAMGVVKTIVTLLMAVESSPQVLRELEIIVLPICVFVLEKSIVDLYDEIFNIIDTCSFCAKAISAELWAVFPLVYKAFKNDATDYLEDMLPSLDNYVSFGSNVIASSPEVLKMFLDVSFTVLQSPESGSNELTRGCQLLESLLLNLRGVLDEHVPVIVQVTMHHLTKKIKTVTFKVHCLETVRYFTFRVRFLTIVLVDQLFVVQSSNHACRSRNARSHFQVLYDVV